MLNSTSFGRSVSFYVVSDFNKFTKLRVLEIPNNDFTSRLSVIFFLREFHLMLTSLCSSLALTVDSIDFLSTRGVGQIFVLVSYLLLSIAKLPFIMN